MRVNGTKLGGAVGRYLAVNIVAQTETQTVAEKNIYGHCAYTSYTRKVLGSN